MAAGSGGPQAGGRHVRDHEAADYRAGPSSRLVTWHRDLLSLIDGLPWLRTLDERLFATIGPWRERHQDSLALEALHGGRWVGHPLHPALSDLPIGLWAGMALLDAVTPPERAGGRLGAAGTLGTAGLIAGAATAVTGTWDWTVADDGDRRVGLFHGLANTAGLTLQGFSLAARLGGRHAAARGLGAAGLAVTAAAAYLGGHLVFGRGVMVNHAAWASGPRRWTRAVRDADLPDGMTTAVEVDGRRVMFCRRQGVLYALDDTCSHAGGLLSRGTITGGVVTCPLHGSRFALGSGQVVRGPASQPQPVLTTRIRDGWIEVRGSRPRPRPRRDKPEKGTGPWHS